MPGMFGEASRGRAAGGTEAALLEALGEALDELNAFRAREGAEIAAEMREHNAQRRRGGRGDGTDPRERARPLFKRGLPSA